MLNRCQEQIFRGGTQGYEVLSPVSEDSDNTTHSETKILISSGIWYYDGNMEKLQDYCHFTKKLDSQNEM